MGRNAHVSDTRRRLRGPHMDLTLGPHDRLPHLHDACRKIKVPAPGQSLPTATPVPASVEAGTKITYKVQSGDSLATIAQKFNTTVEDIISQNPDKLNVDSNNLAIGLEIIVRVNIVTPTPTYAPTSTLAS